MLSAGTCVEWLRDDLGIIETTASSAEVAGRCADTGDVWFVPALLGLGTPVWDFGARGTFTGLTRGSGRPELVRAVLEGVAHRGADLLEAAESDSGLPIASLRIDGGMSSNPVFTQALADACGDPGGDLTGDSRRPPWGPPIWRAWPSAPGRTRKTWRRPGNPAGWWSRPGTTRSAPPCVHAGCKPGPERRAPSLSFRPSTSDPKPVRCRRDQRLTSCSYH